MTAHTKRIEYIDAMRGFTMLLVVITHITGFGYRLSDQDFIDICSPNIIFSLFRMPLFFFISGYILYKKDYVWSLANAFDFLTKKFRIQIISTIIWILLFGILFGFAIEHWFAQFKLGYWFTTTLFTFFVCYTAIKVFCYIFSPNNIAENILLISAALIGVIISPIALFHHFGLDIRIWEYADLKQLQFLQFFIFGIFCKKYNLQFLNIIRNNYMRAIIIIAFTMASIILYYFDLYENQVYFHIIRYFCGYIGILLLFSLFHKYQYTFTNCHMIGKTLQFIGRRTLDIYFIHYFLLPRNLDVIGNFFRNHPNPIIEFTLTLCLSLLVVGEAIIISQIIRLSPFLTYWLLGGKHMSACNK